MRVATGMVAVSMLALAGPASAQRPQTQRQATSPYADGTGNSAVGTLNSGQLDQNYTGPWHRVPTHLPAAGPMRAAAVPGQQGSQPVAVPTGAVPQTAAPRS